MKIFSFNINGLQSAWDAHLKSFIRELVADIFCMQEIRTSKNLGSYFIPEYHEYYCPSSRPGYSGVGLFTRHLPRCLIQGIGVPSRAEDGRAITMETKTFYGVNVYAPASGQNRERLQEKVLWMDDLHRYVSYLEGIKPVILCGDMNVAGSLKDLPSEQVATESAGNTNEEKTAFNRLIDLGYCDVWHLCHPNERGISWTPNWAKNRHEHDTGWRLDYFLVSNKLLDRVRNCQILDANEISDHRCLYLDLK